MKKKSRINFEDKDLNGYTNNQLKSIADYWVRKVLLKQGFSFSGYTCFITGRKFAANKIEVAHFIPRKNMETRYDLKNCHLVSKNSNSFENKIFNEEKYGKLSKHDWEYRQKMIKIYGLDGVEQLEQKAKSKSIWTTKMFIKVIEELKTYYYDS